MKGLFRPDERMCPIGSWRDCSGTAWKRQRFGNGIERECFLKWEKEAKLLAKNGLEAGGYSCEFQFGTFLAMGNNRQSMGIVLIRFVINRLREGFGFGTQRVSIQDMIGAPEQNLESGVEE